MKKKVLSFTPRYSVLEQNFSLTNNQSLIGQML